ncbi:MAG: hypothetical protein PWQ48_1003 [Thermotogaceae bacterium]|nr:hypothetical protein [Thermotogaceae bacterium]
MLWKALVFLGIYAVLHFLYEATGFKILMPFSGVDESVFEHLKLGFWAYFFTNIVEYFIIFCKEDSIFCKMESSVRWR